MFYASPLVWWTKSMFQQSKSPTTNLHEISLTLRQIAFWNASGIIGILTDLAIMYIPIYLVGI